MKGLEILDKLRNTTLAAGEPVSVTFTYAMLNEMARMVEYCEKYQNVEAEILMPAYLYIADEYMYQRHFLLRSRKGARILHAVKHGVLPRYLLAGVSVHAGGVLHGNEQWLPSYR